MLILVRNQVSESLPVRKNLYTFMTQQFYRVNIDTCFDVWQVFSNNAERDYIILKSCQKDWSLY